MERIIYVHIPKTGGSTMRQVMTYNVGRKNVFTAGSDHATIVPWFFALPQAERDRYRHVLGHIRYGIHRLFSSGTARYFTILRQPIERALSAYSYELETPHLPNYEEVKNMSLGDYLRARKVAQTQANWLMGYIPGEPTPKFYGRDMPLPENATDILKQRLTSEFAVTGLLEYYDESLLMLQDVFNWRNVYYFRGNTTSKRLRYKDLSAEDKRLLDEMAGPDFELYDWAKAQLQAKIEALGEPFQRRLADFKAKNPAIGERRHYFRRIRKRVRMLLGLRKMRLNQK